MTSRRTFDSTPYGTLYREVMGRCLAIQEAIGKHDLLFSDTPFEEWKELKKRFWNEYVYPKFQEVYFEMFPDEKGKKDDPDSFKRWLRFPGLQPKNGYRALCMAEARRILSSVRGRGLLHQLRSH